MMGVNNLLCEIKGVYEHMSEAYAHNELSQSYTNKSEENCLLLGLEGPFSHLIAQRNFAIYHQTNDLLNASGIRKDAYEQFYHE